MANPNTNGGLKAAIRRATGVIFSNPVCRLYFIIMFIYSLAINVKSLRQPWISKRYGWALAKVGYVVSTESFLGVGTLLSLPWLGRCPDDRRKHALETRSAKARDEKALLTVFSRDADPDELMWTRSLSMVVRILPIL